MKIKKNNVFKITLKNSDASNLKSIVEKISNPKIGFAKAEMSEDEMRTINKLNRKL